MLLLIPINDVSLTQPIRIKGLDKLVHSGMFFLLFAMLTKAFTERGKTNNKWLIFMICILYGLAMEHLQDLTTYRSFEWGDVIANTVGAMTAMLLLGRKSISGSKKVK